MALRRTAARAVRAPLPSCMGSIGSAQGRPQARGGARERSAGETASLRVRGPMWVGGDPHGEERGGSEVKCRHTVEPVREPEACGIGSYRQKWTALQPMAMIMPQETDDGEVRAAGALPVPVTGYSALDCAPRSARAEWHRVDRGVSCCGGRDVHSQPAPARERVLPVAACRTGGWLVWGVLRSRGQRMRGGERSFWRGGSPGSVAPQAGHT